MGLSQPAARALLSVLMCILFESMASSSPSDQIKAFISTANELGIYDSEEICVCLTALYVNSRVCKSYLRHDDQNGRSQDTPRPPLAHQTTTHRNPGSWARELGNWARPGGRRIHRWSDAITRRASYGSLPLNLFGVDHGTEPVGGRASPVSVWGGGAFPHTRSSIVVWSSPSGIRHIELKL